MSPTRFRNALLAGAALAAATGAFVHASSGAPIEPVTLEQVAAPVDQSGEEKAAPVRPKGGWAIYVAGAAALGLLARLVGFRRIAAGAKAAASATLESAKVAGRAVRRALASPFRAAVFLVSLGLVGFVGVHSFDEMTNLSKRFRQELAQISFISTRHLLRIEQSTDGTKKFLFQLEDGNRIESVLIPDKKRMTLCLSTQVGCAFGCRFCLTGKMGWRRDLSVSETSTRSYVRRRH